MSPYDLDKGEYESGLCTCGRPLSHSSDSFEILSTKINNDCWLVRGAIKLHCSSPGCGVTFIKILNELKIQCEPFICPECHKKNNLDFNIINISKIEPESMTFTKILEDLKIQSKSFSNPECYKKNNLEYNITNISKIEPESTTYEFNAEIICTKCHNKISVKKILKNLISIKKLKISINGVEIEKY